MRRVQLIGQQAALGGQVFFKYRVQRGHFFRGEHGVVIEEVSVFPEFGHVLRCDGYLASHVYFALPQPVKPSAPLREVARAKRSTTPDRRCPAGPKCRLGKMRQIGCIYSTIMGRGVNRCSAKDRTNTAYLTIVGRSERS